MTSQQQHIDEFESLFRRSERAPFAHAEIPLQSVAVVCDGTTADGEKIAADVQSFLPALHGVNTWHIVPGEDFANVGELLQEIDQQQTDLIVTYRHLHEKSLIPQHSLGVYLDVMTQATSIPVLVLPGTAAQPKALPDGHCDRVMVVTDHISGDNRLINYGVRLCADGGTVWLCHVEDDAVFHRYMAAISRIPQIDTEVARTQIEEQLLKEASDFISTCIAVLQESRPDLTYESVVTRGHQLRQYSELVQSHEVDLVVANTKDEGQLAMHGMAYSLSVELTNVAMLLL